MPHLRVKRAKSSGSGSGPVMDAAYAAAKEARVRRDMAEVARQFSDAHGEEKGRRLLASLMAYGPDGCHGRERQ